MDGRQRYQPRSNAETVWLGAVGRCPRCAEGRIYETYLKVADECGHCGLSFREHDAGDAAVVPAILVIGAIVVALSLFLELTFEPAIWVHAVIVGPIAIGLVLFALPVLKGIAVALQHKHRSTETPTRPGGA